MNCEFNASAPFDIFTKPQIYAGPLSGGDFAMVIVNWTPYDYNKSFEVALEKLGFEIREDETIVVRDLWEHAEVDSFTNFGNKIKVDKIPAYGSFSYRISKKIRGQNFME